MCKKILELFSGTGSVSKACKIIGGYETYSVDIETKTADFYGDIMDFDYKQFDKNEFDIIWASPPCVNYSILQNTWIGRIRKGVIYTKEIQEQEMKQADKLLMKTIEIIEYFNPKYWFIENPAYSRMKDRSIMKQYNSFLFDYCMFSNWGYRKRTRIWTNKKLENVLCNKMCGNIVGRKHSIHIGKASDNTTRHSRYRVPEKLISLLLN